MKAMKRALLLVPLLCSSLLTGCSSFGSYQRTKAERAPPEVADKDDEQVARCLSRWDTYDTTVLKASDDLFFIQFTPSLARCGVNESHHVILDAGASYAIDGKGRILASN